MKIKTESYGVFYKDNGEWRGPVCMDTFSYEKAKEVAKSDAKSLKKKTKLFRQVWKSV